MRLANMAMAAEIVAKAVRDIIDINMGCPTLKIIKNGEGAALMRQPERAYAIMRAVVAAVDIPVTVKFRKGWDNNELCCYPSKIGSKGRHCCDCGSWQDSLEQFIRASRLEHNSRGQK